MGLYLHGYFFLDSDRKSFLLDHTFFFFLISISAWDIFIFWWEVSHLVCYPAPFDFLLFPFLGWFCVLGVSQVFLEVSSAVGVLGSWGPGNVSTANSKTLGPVQWEDEAQVTLCRTFGQMAGNRSWLLCTNSGSRCVRWGVFTALQKAPDVLHLSLPCHSALLWDLSALPSILAVPYSCLLL